MATLGRYEVSMVLLVSYLAVLNLIDFLTTSFALKTAGLTEANLFLLRVSALFGSGILPTLTALKLALVAGVVVLALVAEKSGDEGLRKKALWLVVAFVFVLLAVSINNMLWIAG
jgi:hypothetical protein